MLKAVLFLACVASTIVLVKSYDDDSPPQPPPRCPPLCPNNEEYYNCIGGCVPRRCSELGYPLDCNKTCTPGCFCQGGYLRRDDGKCVPTNDCPSCGGDDNAQQGCGSNCNKLCSDVGKPPRPCPPACRFNACDCRPGFWYDSTKKKCVKAVECPCTPPTCPNNEVYYNCTGGCTVKRCSELGYPLDCKKCSPGCICKEGYLRRDDGKCVPTNDCPSCGGDDNAQQGCGTFCGGTCADIGKPPPSSCPIFCSPSGCACRPDFWYDINTKKCVKAGECTPVCKENEEYSPCSNGGCGPKNCSQINDPIICVDPRICIKGCVCRDGYLRTDNGTCVPKNECPRNPTTCPEGEVYNNCLLLPPICPRNEIYNNCSGGCVPRKCSEIGFPLGCLQGEKCIPGCVCKDGNVRRDDGKCIPIPDCPSCGGDDNAEQGCGNHCGKTCFDIGKPPRPCPLFCIFNGCNCRKGFWYDGNQKKCVKAEDCTPTCTKPNEIYDVCPAPCPGYRCDIDPRVIRCAAPPKPGDPLCAPGCRCEDGYARNATGTCVPRDQCEQTIPCGPNQHYNRCPGDCPPQVCGIDPDKVRCLIANPKYGDPRCRPGCECDDGYVRNEDNECIRREDCPPDCPANEVYSSCTNGGCSARNCSQYGKPVPCVKIDPKYCIKGCICVEGYLRNSKGICVPKDQCKPAPTCPDGEVWDPCPTVKCPGDYCPKTRDSPQTCPVGIVCDPPRCVCGVNRKRDPKTGKCISIYDCKKFPCGCNEEYQACPANCPGERCSDYINNSKCPPGKIGTLRICRPQCKCIKGYYRDAKGNCIKGCDCPRNTTATTTTKRPPTTTSKPTCPVGEVWDPCPTVKCPGDYCPKTRNSPQTCPVGIVCDPPRCVCGVNRKRDPKTGKCISIYDCKKFPCGCNEEYQACPAFCPGEQCCDYINNSKCPPGRIGILLICRPQCKCIKGYYRDAKGNCIQGCDCPRNITAITTTTTNKPPVTTGSGLTGILDGITAFTGKCLYERMLSSPSENIIISAMSVFVPIGELCLYSEGAAYDQCIKTLNLKDKQDIRDTFSNFASLYDNVTGVNFSMPAKIYSDDDHKLSNNFITDVVKVFNAETQELDMKKNFEAAAIMNAWVETKTNNHIKDLVSPDMLDDTTRLVLVNALYFKGEWLYKFDEKNTYDADFYLADGKTTKTKLMYQEIKELEYGEISSLDCKAVRILYKGKDSSMIIILPNTNNGSLSLAKDLQDPSNWKKVTDSLRSQKVQLHIPKWEVSTTTDLKDLLKKNGITNWFVCGNSGLNGILEKRDEICITAALQKAWCKVDEEGAEAAAANVIAGPGRPALPIPTAVFKADHNFLYYILLNGAQELPIFSGKYGKPN